MKNDFVLKILLVTLIMAIFLSSCKKEDEVSTVFQEEDLSSLEEEVIFDQDDADVNFIYSLEYYKGENILNIFSNLMLQAEIKEGDKRLFYPQIHLRKSEFNAIGELFKKHNLENYINYSENLDISTDIFFRIYFANEGKTGVISFNEADMPEDVKNFLNDLDTMINKLLEGNSNVVVNFSDMNAPDSDILDLTYRFGNSYSSRFFQIEDGVLTGTVTYFDKTKKYEDIKISDNIIRKFQELIMATEMYLYVGNYTAEISGNADIYNMSFNALYKNDYNLSITTNFLNSPMEIKIFYDLVEEIFDEIVGETFEEALIILED